MKAKPKTVFATEAEMCAKFIAAVDVTWTCYAETAGWDILLARKSDGLQIGVQAKLRFNPEVINQALESVYDVDRGRPDCRAILVPSYATRRLGSIADYIGITVVAVKPECDRWNAPFYPYLPREEHGLNDSWHEQAPLKRHRLPEYVPDVAAGASAPLQLTQWKLAAIKIAITLEARGYVTREDFKAHRIDHRRWVPQGWLVCNSGRFRGGPDIPDFKLQHPRVYAEIAADSAKWMKEHATLL